MRIPLTLVLILMALGTARGPAEEVLRVESKLAKDDPKDIVKLRSRNQDVKQRGIVYNILQQGGGTYSSVQISDSTGKELGRGLHRLPFRCPQDGRYRMTVSMPLLGEKTKYALTMSEAMTTVEDRITATDDKDPKNKNLPSKKHEIQLKEGITYLFLLEGGAWLRVEDGSGNELAKSADSFSPELRFKSPKTGAFQVVATANRAPAGNTPLRYKWTVGEILVHMESHMTSDDTPVKLEQGPCKVHEVKLQADTVYEIRTNSKEIDAVLRLEDADKNVLALDDDSGGELNALIVFKTRKDGIYRIVATTFARNQFGSYILTVRRKP